MKLSDFNFHLPEDLIAQHPIAERDQSRMMVIWRKTGIREHHTFNDLPDILSSEHFLVMNNTRVFPARLRARRPGKNEAIEILFLKELHPGEWLVLAKPARKVPRGQELDIAGIQARVSEANEFGRRVLRFNCNMDVGDLFEKAGEPPLPPYIKRSKGQNLAEDRLRYQTVYARHSGSIAAPTAGLHFTEAILRRLAARGIPRCELLLHVGYGTFQPVRSKEIERHRMESEYYEIDETTAASILRYKAEGRKLTAIGTTTTRCLEFLARGEGFTGRSSAGECNLFIYPDFEFRMIDGLLTNFHLPESTLFMLVCAFAGLEFMRDCYREAILNRYRFYSYGDCMLIL